ncbi:MAG: prepilin-type N-terminal cleavage/methylation domain-containing protein [Verrucomicrobiota bacterium]
MRALQAQRSRAAFSLIEVLIAMSIALLLLGAGVLLISSVNAERRLDRIAGKIEVLARETHLDAVVSRQTRVLEIDRRTFGKGIQVFVRLPGIQDRWIRLNRPHLWTFSPNGLCEPLSLRLEHDDGRVELEFDPLTGETRRKSVIVNR